MKQCDNCHRWVDENEFLERDDRSGQLYRWCIGCMKEQGRDKDWPPESERGGGSLEIMKVILES